MGRRDEGGRGSEAEIEREGRGIKNFNEGINYHQVTHSCRTALQCFIDHTDNSI